MKKQRRICVALFKKHTANILVTEVSERDSQTAEIVEVSDVGWLSWLWGKWFETPDDQKNHPLPKESQNVSSSNTLTLLLSHPPVYVLGCSSRDNNVGWDHISADKNPQQWNINYNCTHSFFLHTSPLYGYSQMTTHREPFWLLPLSLKHDMLGS